MRTQFAPWTHVLLRVGAGVLFMEHGAQKLFGWLGGVGGPGAAVPLVSQMGLAGLFELVGGALLVIGLFTVPVAAVLFLEMIWAYFQAHAPQGGWPVQNQGELALLYATIFAFLAGNGAGPLSVDAWIPARLHRERRRLFDRRAHATA